MQQKIQVQPDLQHGSRFVMPEMPNEQSKAWLLWETMAQIFSDRWVKKNGVTPSMAWMALISKYSDEQLAWSVKRCMEYCSSGNHWPPDLAEFAAILGSYSANQLGLQVSDVMDEYWRYVRDHWRYGSVEAFPWKHPVLYQICPELRREGARRNLPQKELGGLAKRLLSKWIKYVDMGLSIPPIQRKLAAPEHPTGPTPAQQMLAGQRYVK